jgi:ABC-type sugar transport system ATPase subunit
VSAPFLEARKITKRFGAVVALADVDLTLARGEVLALVGDNGAGKSTFIKILAGAHAPTSGEILLDGAPVGFASPLDAAAAGIATIYQELALAENLSVYQNVFLGREISRRVLGIPFLRRAAMRARVVQLMADLDAHIPDPEAAVGSLSGGQRQAVAIARALELDARLVIMDEPTAALAVAETRKVLDLVRHLCDRGKAVLLISHNIQEVFQVADRIVVFRRGQKVAERLRATTDPEEIVALITGVHPSFRGTEARGARTARSTEPAVHHG